MEQKKCWFCDKPIPSDTSKCPYCGAPISKEAPYIADQQETSEEGTLKIEWIGSPQTGITGSFNITFGEMELYGFEFDSSKTSITEIHGDQKLAIKGSGITVDFGKLNLDPQGNYSCKIKNDRGTWVMYLFDSNGKRINTIQAKKDNSQNIFSFLFSLLVFIYEVFTIENGNGFDVLLMFGCGIGALYFFAKMFV